MSPVPASAIAIADGEITIDAELLAPKLGLSAEALKAEMRRATSPASPRQASTRTPDAYGLLSGIAREPGPWWSIPTAHCAIDCPSCWSRAPRPPPKPRRRTPIT